MNNVEIDLRLLRLIFCLCVITTVFPVVSKAQYKGDDIPGFLGLQSGTQAPPGIYVGNVVWVYPTSTIKDNSGHAINLPGSLTSTAEIMLLNVVTNYKLFGGNVGGSAGFPFIKNRIELNSLDVTPSGPHWDKITVVKDFVVSPPDLKGSKAEFYVEYITLGQIDRATLRHSALPRLKVRAGFDLILVDNVM